jgi:hypothetical protein
VASRRRRLICAELSHSRVVSTPPVRSVQSIEPSDGPAGAGVCGCDRARGEDDEDDAADRADAGELGDGEAGGQREGGEQERAVHRRRRY